MANIRPITRLRRIEGELNKIRKHIELYSGIGNPSQAQQLDRAATAVTEEAAMIVHVIQTLATGRESNVIRKVRQALGYTYP